MGFLRKVRGLSLLDKVRKIDIRQSLNIKPLLLHIEPLQLRWYGHVTRMSHERTVKQLMNDFPSGKRPRGRPRTSWRNYVKDLAWWRLGIPLAELPLYYLQEIEMLGDSNSAAPATAKGQASKKKYTKLIQCFLQK